MSTFFRVNEFTSQTFARLYCGPEITSIYVDRSRRHLYKGSPTIFVCCSSTVPHIGRHEDIVRVEILGMAFAYVYYPSCLTALYTSFI
jgi:hypothetical protein